MTRIAVALACALAGLALSPAMAQRGTVVGGSGDVQAGGESAARVGDETSDGGALVQGSTNVFINGRPAVTVGDGTDCGGLVVAGEGVGLDQRPADCALRRCDRGLWGAVGPPQHR